jgi:hypothetical protein
MRGKEAVGSDTKMPVLQRPRCAARASNDLRALRKFTLLA